MRHINTQIIIIIIIIIHIIIHRVTSVWKFFWDQEIIIREHLTEMATAYKYVIAREYI